MDDVKVSVNKGVQTIVYNRPKKRNAISKAMYGRIADILKSAALDDNILVTVITGAGDFYSSGADFSDSAASMSVDSETDVVLKQASDIIKKFVAAFIDYPKILIAIVNGPAIGIAATTLGLCDLVFASDKAYFTTPFTKLGLTAEGCSSLTFPQIMGRRKAVEMLYFNYKMTANEALQYGFVNQVIPHSEINKLWPVIYKFASLPRESLLSVKRLVRNNERAALHSANESECKELENRWQSDEFLNGLQKMFSSRSSKL